MQPYELRLVSEHSEMESRIDRLNIFIQDERFKTIPAAHQELLHKQVSHMYAYKKCLWDRIKLIGEPI